ncbi:MULTISPECIES: cadmium resistance transporter [unclassified Crossiella]|uniref:cadmium resistance transporter n=1 Tax=unclassified Crossiella TaxID=2620835 RepID=UPI001FFF2935|nr:MULTISPECIES: cadmium resistance transporter [unclassified Crossiella]MCK2239160.1 cadmium resistance transporter [Crossiella sp. S99.2]MCK2251271.1 cadmium resistance transporter [Crossiella sp. S99.1]
MGLGLLGQAVVMFVVTNVDDIVLLALFFGQATGSRGVIRVVAGQYLGFAGILAASIVGALGAGLLPAPVIPYLGLLPLVLGLRAGWQAWRERRSGGEDESEVPGAGPTVAAVAAVTFANGGDNIGVYVPVFANAGTTGLIVYTVVFLLLVGVLCVLGRYFATRPLVARALARWGHVALPVVLIGIGLLILVEGGVFRL